MMEFKLFVIVYVMSSSVLGLPTTAPRETKVPFLCGNKHEIEAMSEKCCILAPFFAKEIVAECGGSVRMVQKQMPFHNATFFRRSLDDCNGWNCILDRYHLLVNGLLDDERFCKHLDRWVGLYPEFESAMFNAKVECRMRHHLIMPIEPCDVSLYINCYRMILTQYCPISVNTPTCLKQRQFFKECSQFLNPDYGPPTEKTH